MSFQKVKTAIFAVWLRNIVEEHERSFDENNIRDFIDAFILEKKKGKDSSFTVKQCDLT